jgi:hypothetical protein
MEVKKQLVRKPTFDYNAWKKWQVIVVVALKVYTDRYSKNI